MNKVILMSPVADMVSLNAAISAKADAVYFGVKAFNMRTKAKNFEVGELVKVVKLCHDNKIKAYLTLNTIVYDDEIEKIRKVLVEAKKAKIDAIIAWDMAVIEECEKLNLKIHLSTQSSVSSKKSFEFYKKKIKGLESVNLARELSLEQIKKIKVKNVDIEVFIHGAMCVSVSGRCFISQFQFNKSANRGECLQPCRREYIVEDEENKKLKLGSNYVMSPKDLCCLGFLDQLIEAGIDRFKIEGRNRSPEYVKTTTEVYREAIDAYYDKKKINKKKLIGKLKTVYNRDFSSGFFLGKPINEWTNEYGSKAVKQKKYVGYVKKFYKKINVAEVKLESFDLRKNDEILVIGNKTGVVEDKVKSIQVEGKSVKVGEKGNIVGVKLKNIVRANDKVFLFN